MARGDIMPLRGRVGQPLLMEVTRELTQEDLLRLADSPKVTVPVLQKLRAVHHRQAQLLASGKKVTEVAAIVGCTVQRLVQLQVDPTFTELVKYYQDQTMVAHLEDTARIQAKLIDAGELAIDEIGARLEDPEKRAKMRTGDLRQIAEMAMDRTVAPIKAAPQSTIAPAAVTISFGTPVGAPPGAKVIDVEVENDDGK